jgi:hypothetical protein
MVRHILLLSLCALAVACGGPEDSMEDSPDLKTTRQRLALFDYVVSSSTSSAMNPFTSGNSQLAINGGETVMIGTCGINESAYSGDTYLRLFDPEEFEKASNDDYCGGLGSKVSYTATDPILLTIRAGCYGAELCSGTVAISRRRGEPLYFEAANTNNATVNTYNKQYHFNGGDVVRLSTCGSSATGANAIGDTFLRLYQNSAGLFYEVAANDTADAGGCGVAAEIVYTVPFSGYYQVRMGCAANTPCAGNLAVYVE